MNSKRKAVSLGFATKTLLRRTKKSGAVEVAYHLTWKKSPERRKKNKNQRKGTTDEQLLVALLWHGVVRKRTRPIFHNETNTVSVTLKSAQLKTSVSVDFIKVVQKPEMTK